jgi:hypothetical protein
VKQNLKKIIFFTTVIIFSIINTQFIAAQTRIEDLDFELENNPSEITLTAVPTRLGDDYSLMVKPGEKLQTTIEVKNPSDYPATVETFARDFIIGEDGETPIAIDDDVSSKWSLAKWITITPNNVVLKARGSATILVNIEVPIDALPGGRYAIILHKPVTEVESGETTGSKVTAQVGTLLYVLIDGPITENAVINTFKFDKFSEFGPVAYNFSIKNNSSLHIRPRTIIKIKNMFGKELASLTAEQKNIFPDSSREFAGEWNTHWGFGKYTAVLTSTYGTNIDKNLTAETSFWLIPVRTVLVVILVIVLIIIIIMATKKKYERMLDMEKEKMRKLDEKLENTK